MTIEKQKEDKIETKTITTKITPEKTKEVVMSVAKAECDPDYLINQLGNEVLPKFLDGSPKEKEEAGKLMAEKSWKLLIIWGLETHYPLATATQKKYRPLAIEFANKIIKEYDCKTSSEKALAEIVVNSYLEVITWSERLNNCYSSAEYISDERTHLLTMAGKQLDRAHRHFATALSTLKQIKSPPIELNVKAKTAFVSQNQQINAFSNIKDKQNESIEPK